jgi:hypothetical protein
MCMDDLSLRTDFAVPLRTQMGYTRLDESERMYDLKEKEKENWNYVCIYYCSVILPSPNP